MFCFGSKEAKDFESLEVFDGFGLPDFQQVVVTKEMVADLIRWQCFYIMGEGLDQEALQEIKDIGRNKFMVV